MYGVSFDLWPDSDSLFHVAQPLTSVGPAKNTIDFSEIAPGVDLVEKHVYGFFMAFLKPGGKGFL